MKVFSKNRRSVPETRKKYGKPETKKEALERLKKERESREARATMIREIQSRNKDEFYFSFYSLDKNMIKRTVITQDELTKILKYIDSEILRCERILEDMVRPKSRNMHIKFTGDKAIAEINEDPMVISTGGEYEKYIQNLIEKRKEVVEKLRKLKNN
ncbi:uncharacterized protein VICG_00861 [Vittaforma corneae ATCC 50505]|uniref:Uncharacterized protein n=1 Tax=Vittaforma corneae (strain ATCC 50505) TaxID=993615 RepID=L2GN15_VITCO|nr:uncharacterized protein VICG_00861 [Vittaforma corneae ATCC 50505]ELA42014.1 hypothetical protein VICG_00861 [Vittaforma corneae ATCC 50505]